MKTVAPKLERPRVRVLRDLRQGILNGRWNDGGMFPAENELVTLMQVSRSTLRLVLKQLETEGLLRTEQGRGRLVVRQRQGLMTQTVAIVRCSPVRAEHFRNTGAEKAVEAAATEALRASSYHVLSLNAGASDGALNSLVEEPPRGVVADHDAANLPKGQAALKQLIAAGSAVVVSGDMPGVEEFDRVVSDHADGSYQLARWLIQRGHRQIVRVWEGSSTSYWLDARDKGFSRAMREAGLDAGEPVWVQCVTPAVDQDDPRAAEVFELRARQYAGFLADVVLRQPAPQALMTMNDVTMLLVARALRILGRPPGPEIAVVGYDNFWPQSKDRRFEPYIPPVTVDKHNDLIGRSLAELLLARLEKKLPAEPQRVMVRPQLVVT